MNTPTPATQRCDECGKDVAQIWRVYKGHKYCSTCYSREFKRRLCPKCGNFAKLLICDPNAICQKCQVAKPCTRCGKTVYEVGKITEFGPVCGHCATYFREPEPCEVCGKPSKRLSRVSRLGHDCRVCPSCARVDHGVCEACHRNRLLEHAEDGRMLCKTCHEQGEVPCPECEQPMPAGRGRQCEACYWRGLLEKRIEMDCAAFSAPAMVEHFRAFGEWLGKGVGYHKAAISLKRYLPFFLDIENQWKTIPEYAVLLKHFGTLRLRRVLLPMKWMQEAHLVVPDSQAKQDDSDQRRIASTLDKVGKTGKVREILDGYHQVLMLDLKDEATTLRSIRLAMMPAAALLLKGREMGRMPPDQKVLDGYLEQTPGQRAAVTGFVCYLRDKHGISIALPKANTRRRLLNRKKRLEAEMLSLMREGGEGEKFRQQWLSVALAYFYGLPICIGRHLIIESVEPSENGLIVAVKGKSYWIPLARPEAQPS